MRVRILHRIGLVAMLVVGVLGLAGPANAQGPSNLGLISGMVRSDTGAALPNVFLEIWRDGNPVANTGSGHNGRYEFTQVEPGTYTMFIRFVSGHEVWYPDVADQFSATPFEVRGHGRTKVDVTRPPVGTLIIIAVDDETGERIPGICFFHQDAPFPFNTVCTEANGEARLVDVPVGTYDGGSFDQNEIYVNGLLRGAVVTAGQTTTATVRLQKSASLRVNYVDAVTGDPASACLYLLVDNAGVGGSAACGPVAELKNLFPIQLKLFASPSDGVHGAQWVGESGGTGDPDMAKVFDLDFGDRVEVTVELDGAGSVSGVITDDVTGTGVRSVCPSVTLPSPFFGSHPNSFFCTDTDGFYRFRDLGPYEWKMAFPVFTAGYAWEWSGDAPNRAEATPVQVVVGAETTTTSRWGRLARSPAGSPPRPGSASNVP